MRGVLCEPEKIFHLTMFGPWKHVVSMSHPSILSLVTSPMTPCSPQVAVVDTLMHTALYPRQFFQYTASVIFVSVRSMSS